MSLEKPFVRRLAAPAASIIIIVLAISAEEASNLAALQYSDADVSFMLVKQ